VRDLILETLWETFVILGALEGEDIQFGWVRTVEYIGGARFDGTLQFWGFRD